MRGLPVLRCAVLILIGGGTRAVAGGHADVSVIPIGQAQVAGGRQDVSYRLPTGPAGVLDQALVFVAVQPRVAASDTDAGAGATTRPAEKAEDRQVAAVLTFTVAGRAMPAWSLEPYPTAYVMNLAAVKANPQYAQQRLGMTVEVDTKAPGAAFTILGMPDPLLVDSTTNGPLVDLAASATDPEVKAYLQALVREFAGEKAVAREAYRKLGSAKNGRVARLARRGLRMLAYQLRKRQLSGNFMEHYRWGLYLQQCGLYASAYREFEECRIIFPWQRDAQFRAGEALERIGGPAYSVMDYMDRAGAAVKVEDPNDWHILVAILKTRGDKTLSPEEIRQIQDRWLLVEEMIYGATGGVVRVVAVFHEIAGDEDQAYLVRDGGYPAPADDLVESRGWFDGVVSVVPRLADDAGKSHRTFGGDEGPNGAALSCLFHDAHWWEYLEAWYDQWSWAVHVGEVGRGYPHGNDVLGCGLQPAAHGGSSVRAALRHYFPSAMLHRPKITDVPVPGSYAQLWKVEGPFAVKDAGTAGGPPGHHVLDPIPPGPAAKSVQLVADGEFIDLAALLPDAGWALARATCWVYSPKDQEVRMWLGQNDGMAVWINGRLVHEGRYYSAGRYEDRNLADTVAAYADLKEGWNETRIVVESWPAPRNKGWGFSVRFCTWDNKPVPGLACVNRRPEKDLVPPHTPPQVGPYYAWRRVRDDYHDALPVLTGANLETVTGVKGLRITGAIDKMDGFCAVTAPGQARSPTYRVPPRSWRSGEDRDVVLNNVLDWSRECCAAYRYRKDGRWRDLLILKPDAVEAYLMLLQEPTAAAELFGNRPVADRLLGYAVVPAGLSERTLLVVDALLGGTDEAGRAAWPVDEEDLLTPFGKYIPNVELEPAGPPAP